MPAKIAKKGSGQFDLTRQIGGRPNAATGTKPGAGSGSDASMAAKHSGRFELDRSAPKPRIKKPAK